MNPKTILVTGGAGFIGTNLISRLLDENNKVLCLDNFVSGSPRNIIQFNTNKNFKFIRKDITSSLEHLPKIDEIYNLACIASPPRYQKQPLTTLKTNTIGLFNLLELTRKNHARFLQASTSEIYGEPSCQSQDEDYNGNCSTLSSRACYDEGKRIAETITHTYFKQYGVDTKIARIFNTYGPYMNPSDGRVVSNFISQILNNEPITIYGDGEQTRSFCYVDDTINGLINLMASQYNFPINIGNPHEITINQLVNELEKIFNKSFKKRNLPPASDDPTHRCPNINKAQNLLSYSPKVSLKRGLEKTIEYFVDNDS